ncbi:helix-turn-helix domain-containing protein [Streptomyces sp. NPDC006367]|uniref:WD40 repeat domain-containing protein n=1 Tax=unclassified Streptomyces TaxID=2593676 RepID=UPI0033AC4B1D
MTIGGGTYQSELETSAAELRRLRGRLPQWPDLKQIADRAGVAASTVSAVLNGKTHPGLDVYMALVRVLLTFDTGGSASQGHPDIQLWRDRWWHVQELKEQHKITRPRQRTALPHAAAHGLAEQVVLSAMRRGDRIQMFPMADGLDGVWDVAFSPDGRLIATAHGLRTVQLWDTIEQRRVGTALVGGHVEQVQTVRFSPDGKLLASGSADGRIMLWDVATRQSLGEPLTVSSGRAWAVGFSPDNRLLLGAGRTIRVWDISAPDRPEAIAKLGGNLSAGLAVSAGGLLATGHGDGTAQLWDLEAFEKRGSALRGHTVDVTATAFSPDGKLLATASGPVVQLWDVRSQTMFSEPLTEAVGIIQTISFSPDGRLLTAVVRPDPRAQTGTDDEDDEDDEGTFDSAHAVHVWETASWKAACAPLLGHTGTIWGAAFSSDSRLFATGSADGQLRLWILPAPD